MSEMPEVLNEAEAAEYCRLSVNSFRKAVKAGDLPKPPILAVRRRHVWAAAPGAAAMQLASARKKVKTYLRGSRLHQAKITEADAIEIRRLSDAGITQAEIGRRFGISRQQRSPSFTGGRGPMFNDLLSRLEKASEPTRELFEAAYIAVRGPVDWDVPASFQPFRHFLDLIAIGAWLDAAMSLVPKGWGPSIRIFGAGNGWATLYGETPGISGDSVDARHMVPALALVIASLKALNQMKGK